MHRTPLAAARVRNAFLQSLAASSAVHYVLGVGDRHLDNYMFNERTGRLMAIDYGHAFGMYIDMTKS